jgi:hypothetical protein
MTDKPKLTGVEMMLNSLMRAAGFNPDEIQKQMALVIGGFQGGLNKVAETLVAIQKEQIAQRQIAEKISRDLEILKAAAGIHDGPALLSDDRPQPIAE